MANVMTGLWDQLSPEQQAAALAYRGPVASGSAALPAIKEHAMSETETLQWKCCGCGKISPDGNRNCECSTSALFRKIGSHQTDIMTKADDICTSLRSALTAAETARDQAMARVRELRDVLIEAQAVLAFYAVPVGTDVDGSPIAVPDFYDELCFGESATQLLPKLRVAIRAAQALTQAQETPHGD